MPEKTTPARLHWMSFPGAQATQEILASATPEAEGSKTGPPVPYQFTLTVMQRLYSKLMPNVVQDDGGSAADPDNFDAASKADIRAIGYFSWHNERKLFVTRRVYPSYFDFFSLSFVYEGWGALGELLQDIGKQDFSTKLCTKVANVCRNHRFLPFLKEAHRLDYKAALVIPFFEGMNGEPATVFAKANLKGAMVFYLSTRGALPDTTDEAFRERVATFSHQFARLVCLNEERIQAPVPRTRKDIKEHVWEYWEEAREKSEALVFAELRISGVRPGDKENIVVDVQSALSGGDFVCLRDTSSPCQYDLRFWISCLDKGKGPDANSEDAFATKLKRSIAEAVANACANVGQLQLEMKIHGRHLP